MKWVFILLLVSNVGYLGWELDRETSLSIQRQLGRTVIPPDAASLKLLSELTEKPVSKSFSLPGEETQMEAPSNPSEPEMLVTTEMNQNPQAPSNDLFIGMPELINVDHDRLLLNMVRNTNREQTQSDSRDKVCFSYGPFAQEADFSELQEWFGLRNQAFSQRLEYEQDKELFWVYLAPLPDRARAEATLSELENQGVKDYRLIHKGSFKNAISLGLFSSQAGVNRRLSELNSKGYQPVVVPYHDVEATRIYWLDVVLEGDANLTAEVFSGFPARYNSLPKDCDQIAMLADNP